MIDAAAIREIIVTYKKHGWLLRRVLLSAATKERLGKEKDTLFSAIPVVDSDIDAAWFSRPPKSGGVSWEIRYLGDAPFALLKNMDEEGSEFENGLQVIESRLRLSAAAKKSA